MQKAALVRVPEHINMKWSSLFSSQWLSRCLICSEKLIGFLLSSSFPTVNQLRDGCSWLCSSVESENTLYWKPLVQELRNKLSCFPPPQSLFDWNAPLGLCSRAHHHSCWWELWHEDRPPSAHLNLWEAAGELEPVGLLPQEVGLVYFKISQCTC